MFTLTDFVRESNRIEGIERVLQKEVAAHEKFLQLDRIDIQDMTWFVQQVQPDAQLRDVMGRNVRVGNYYPPQGGIAILGKLGNILHQANIIDDKPAHAYEIHHEYESLHPYTDGNGRSGRMLWLWMMREAPLGFLHTFYYQALRAGR